MAKKSENYSIHKAMRNDAFLNASIYDWNGNRVSLGDRICVELPETEIINGRHIDDIQGIYASEKKIYGILSMRLSEGIGLVVDEIENKNKDDDELPITNGWYRLKYTKYKWYKYLG